MYKEVIVENIEIVDVEAKCQNNNYIKTRSIFGIIFYRHKYTLTQKVIDPKHNKGDKPIGFTKTDKS